MRLLSPAVAPFLFRSVRQTRIAISLLAMIAPGAQAFTTELPAGSPSQIYLQIGTGSFSGESYKTGGRPVVNSTINVVSVNVPVTAAAGGTPQAMSASGGATPSFYDGAAFCTSGQLYVGGYHRRFSWGTVFSGSATLTANSATALTNGTLSIPFTEISWTSGGSRGSGAPFASGTFSGNASQSIGSIAVNEWAENCHSFTFANSTLRAGGTYTGRVTYTLSAP